VLGSRRTALREAAAAVDRTLTQDQRPVMNSAATPGSPPRQQRVQQGREERRAQRLARYDAVIALHQEGHSHAAISRQTGLGRRTVRRYLRATAFPERAAAPARPTMLAPYAAYLRARWTGGCHNAQQLWREIRSQGYAGEAANVRRYLARWRPEPGRPGPTACWRSASSTLPETRPRQSCRATWRHEP
jgi:transposase